MGHLTTFTEKFLHDRLEAYHAYLYQRVQGDYLLIPYQGIPINRFCVIWDLRCLGKNLFSPVGFLPVIDRSGLPGIL